MPRALASAAVPLSMAWLGTVLATAMAACLAYCASRTFQADTAAFTGERPSPRRTALGHARMLAARGVATVSRAIPEVFWAMLLASFFQLGTLPGMFALALHSTGVLARVFTESVDAVPMRTLEGIDAASGSRPRTFLYGACPPSRHSGSRMPSISSSPMSA